MKYLTTILSILISMNGFSQSANVAIGGGGLSPYVAPDTSIYTTEDICFLMSKIDTTGGFYFSQDGVNWYYNKFGTGSMPIGESFVYIYPRREKIKK